jgi:hypothetical protein
LKCIYGCSIYIYNNQDQKSWQPHPHHPPHSPSVENVLVPMEHQRHTVIRVCLHMSTLSLTFQCSVLSAFGLSGGMMTIAKAMSIAQAHPVCIIAVSEPPPHPLFLYHMYRVSQPWKHYLTKKYYFFIFCYIIIIQ